MTTSPDPDAIHSVPLPDGRRLAWREFGAADGAPCLFHPGAATSSLAGLAYDEAAQQADVRLISIDRPGLGASDPAPGRRLIDWAGDLAALADSVGLARFAVFGHSGGGSHALAAAFALADRTTLTIAAAALGPYAEPWMTAPGMLSPQAEAIYAAMLADPEGALAGFRVGFSDNEEALLAQVRALDPATPDGRFYRDRGKETLAMVRGNIDAARQDARWLMEDIQVLLQPWGFRLEETRGRVAWWHGEADFLNVSFASGREAARRLPDCTFHAVPGAGHMASLERASEILALVRNAA